MDSTSNITLEAKVVVLGSQGVGKTSIVQRYITGEFNRHQSPTIGASYFSCKMCIDNRSVKLQVWDTAGQERFRSMAPMYYRNSSAALIVYDITSRSSFEAMQSWIQELKTNVETHLVLVVIGNKCDLEDTRVVSLQEAVQYAAQIGAKHFLTSAVDETGIQDVFVEIAQSLIREEARHLGLRGSIAMSTDTLEPHGENIRVYEPSDALPPPRSKCCS